MNDVAEHLHEAAIAVPGKARVAGASGESFHGGVVQAQVQDGVHHPRHRVACAAADGEQERVVRVAELPACPLFQPRERLPDRVGEPVGRPAAGAHEGHARLGGDREAGRYELRAEHARHLGEVGALATEQIAHLA